MKTLKIFAAVNSSTNTGVFADVINSLDNAEVNFETDIEKAVEVTNLKNYDLLIADKALPEADFRKINRLVELIHPDAATLHLNFNDEDFTRFKMSGIMEKWREAQSDPGINFIDGMNSF